jgi:UDP-2,3-diacylglucosamine pyrophosphatase LpxH
MTRFFSSNKTTIIKSFSIVCLLVFIQFCFSAPPSDTLTVIHITDTHICNLAGYQPEFAKARHHYGSGSNPLKKFFKNIPRKVNGDMVIVTGDLIDFYEAETEAGPMLATQIEQFASLQNFCPVPLLLTLGNHDITSYWFEESGSTIRSFQYLAEEARACWTRNFFSFQQGTFYKHTLDVGKISYQLLFLDNGYSLQNGSFLDKIQLDWLNFQVKSAGQNPVIIFMHKYLPVPDFNRDGVIFSEKSQMPVNDSTCSRGFLKILNENKNIFALFAGHGHKNVVEDIPFPTGHRILETETAAFAQNENNWRLIKFTEKSVMVFVTGEENKVEFIKTID